MFNVTEEKKEDDIDTTINNNYTDSIISERTILIPHPPNFISKLNNSGHDITTEALLLKNKSLLYYKDSSITTAKVKEPLIDTNSSNTVKPENRIRPVIPVITNIPIIIPLIDTTVTESRIDTNVSGISELTTLVSNSTVEESLIDTNLSSNVRPTTRVETPLIYSRPTVKQSFIDTNVSSIISEPVTLSSDSTVKESLIDTNSSSNNTTPIISPIFPVITATVKESPIDTDVSSIISETATLPTLVSNSTVKESPIDTNVLSTSFQISVFYRSRF